jgi:hypothetical protein
MTLLETGRAASQRATVKPSIARTNMYKSSSNLRGKKKIILAQTSRGYYF